LVITYNGNWDFQKEILVTVAVVKHMVSNGDIKINAIYIHLKNK